MDSGRCGSHMDSDTARVNPVSGKFIVTAIAAAYRLLRQLVARPREPSDNGSAGRVRASVQCQRIAGCLGGPNSPICWILPAEIASFFEGNFRRDCTFGRRGPGAKSLRTRWAEITPFHGYIGGAPLDPQRRAQPIRLVVHSSTRHPSGLHRDRSIPGPGRAGIDGLEASRVPWGTTLGSLHTG